MPGIDDSFKEFTLHTLRAIGEERKKAIDEAKQMRANAAEAFRLAQETSRRQHHEANKTLVQAVAVAQKDGVRKSDICTALGMTVQNLNQMRRAVEAREEELHGKSKPANASSAGARKGASRRSRPRRAEAATAAA